MGATRPIRHPSVLWTVRLLCQLDVLVHDVCHAVVLRVFVVVVGGGTALHLKLARMRVSTDARACCAAAAVCCCGCLNVTTRAVSHVISLYRSSARKGDNLAVSTALNCRLTVALNGSLNGNFCQNETRYTEIYYTHS